MSVYSEFMEGFKLGRKILYPEKYPHLDKTLEAFDQKPVGMIGVYLGMNASRRGVLLNLFGPYCFQTKN